MMSISRIIVAGGEDALKNGVKAFKKTKTLATLVEKNGKAAKKLLKAELKKGSMAEVQLADKTIYVRRTGNKGKIQEITKDQFNKAVETAEKATTIDTATLVRNKLAKKFDGVKGKDSNTAFKAFQQAVESKTASLKELFEKATAAFDGGIKKKSKKDFDGAFKLLQNAYEHQSPLQSSSDRLRGMVQAELTRATNKGKDGAKTRAKAALDAIDSGNLDAIKKTTKAMREAGLKKVKGKEFEAARETYKAAAKGQPVASSAPATPAAAKTPGEMFVEKMQRPTPKVTESPTQAQDEIKAALRKQREDLAKLSAPVTKPTAKPQGDHWKDMPGFGNVQAPTASEMPITDKIC